MVSLCNLLSVANAADHRLGHVVDLRVVQVFLALQRPLEARLDLVTHVVPVRQGQKRCKEKYPRFIQNGSIKKCTTLPERIIYFAIPPVENDLELDNV